MRSGCLLRRNVPATATLVRLIIHSTSSAGDIWRWPVVPQQVRTLTVQDGLFVCLLGLSVGLLLYWRVLRYGCTVRRRTVRLVSVQAGLELLRSELDFVLVAHLAAEVRPLVPRHLLSIPVRTPVALWLRPSVRAGACASASMQASGRHGASACVCRCVNAACACACVRVCASRSAHAERRHWMCPPSHAVTDRLGPADRVDRQHDRMWILRLEPAERANQSQQVQLTEAVSQYAPNRPVEATGR
jgi:hypothetical protein